MSVLRYLFVRVSFSGTVFTAVTFFPPSTMNDDLFNSISSALDTCFGEDAIPTGHMLIDAVNEMIYDRLWKEFDDKFVISVQRIEKSYSDALEEQVREMIEAHSKEIRYANQGHFSQNKSRKSPRKYGRLPVKHIPKQQKFPKQHKNHRR